MRQYFHIHLFFVLEFQWIGGWHGYFRDQSKDGWTDYLIYEGGGLWDSNGRAAAKAEWWGREQVRGQKDGILNAHQICCGGTFIQPNTSHELNP